MEPAKSIIERFANPKAGLTGEAVVAGITKVALSTPYGWQKARREGGTDGFIPRKYHPALLEYAQENKIRLRQSDFYITEAAE
jgi:hypothetical protein